MAKLGTYTNETAALVDDNDRLIGTDGGTGDAGTEGTTKNFSVGVLKGHITGGVSEGYIPLSNDTGSFSDSVIQYTTPDGAAGDRIVVGGDIQFIGNLLGADGSQLLTNTGSTGEPAPAAEDPFYATNVVTTAQTLALYTVHVLTLAADTTVTLPSDGGLVDGAWIKISNLSNPNIITISGGGNTFMNDSTAGELILDSEEASFELVFVAGIGWVVIGAQSHA